MEKTLDDSPLNQILDSIYDVESYVAGKTHEDFLNTSLIRMATLKQLEIIAQLASELPEDIKNEYREIPWAEIQKFGDNLHHEYYGINHERIWRIAKQEITPLRKQIERVIDKKL
ncbi:HepT-like ribonuclease domain-containing protein [Hugenholtzia roseola]|uniref:HepT-like ribonuclease domain-containing protein n=1 Tax=Hugenholtzia roseola TaxID=1002 RepID=UPI0004122AC9|nr:HepT-like ribonuclease domain-containing protein [Hugenholtzia roseola]